MKREIKFRAYQDGKMLISPISSNYGLNRFFGLLYEDASIMQYTGLKDKNGVEIYESDIVKHELATEPEEKGFICEWDNKDACYVFKNVNYDFDEDYNMTNLLHLANMIIIGNIYSNPELLNNA